MGDLVIRVLTGEKTRALARKLKAKAPNLMCPVCGHRDFALIEDEDANSRTTLSRKPLGGGLPDRFHTQPLLTLACTTCGSLQRFAQAVVDGARPEDYGLGVDDDEHR